MASELSKSLTKGRGLTSNKDHIFSVSHYEYKKQIYLLATGGAENVDVFRLANFNDSSFASMFLLCGYFMVFFFFLFECD